MGQIGHAPPEAEPWSILDTLGIDVALAKRAIHKLYFEEADVVRPTWYPKEEAYETYHDVFFIPNDTKHGSLFAMKYGTKINENLYRHRI
jgi:hypothetical protein